MPSNPSSLVIGFQEDTFGNDTPLYFGDNDEYWLVYDSADTAFQLWSTDVDGSGSDGRIFEVQDGGDDIDLFGDLTLGNDLLATGGELIFDESGGHIEQSILENDSVTVAGNTVALGGSTAVAHDDLSDNVAGATDEDNSGETFIQDVTMDAHGHVTALGTATVHSRYTDEEAQDTVAAALSGGTGVNISYDDANDTITISSHSRYTDEEAQDAVGTIMSGGTGVTVTYDDAGNTITIASHAKYTDEEAQDAVGTILGSNFTYDDAGNSITLTSDTVTVAGNAVALGGSTAVDHADLSNIGSSDHHTRYADSEARSAVETGPVDYITGPSNSMMLRFDQNDGWIEVTDTDGATREDIVVGRVYLDDGVGWFTGSHTELNGISSDQHHSQSHNNTDHTTKMVEDASGDSHVPHEIQINGTDGNGIINFKT